MNESLACVYCGSHRHAEILYGRVPHTESLRADLAAGKVVLGGCIVSSAMPTRRCLDCGKEWRHEEPTTNQTTRSILEHTKSERGLRLETAASDPGVAAQVKTLQQLHDAISALNQQMLAGEYDSRQAKTAEEKAKHAAILATKEREAEALRARLSTACAANPQAKAAWIDLHQGLLRDLVVEVEAANPPSAKVILQAAQTATAQWDQVAAGKSVFVAINHVWLKDYRQRLAAKLAAL